MRVSFSFMLLFVLSGLLYSCRSATPPVPQKPEVIEEKPLPVPAREKWQEEWERTIASGIKEGRVAIYSSAGNELRLAFMEAFPKKTGIALEMTIGKSAALAEKVLTERRNGLYLLDIFMSGLTSLVTTLKEANALDPIETILMLPEVTDKSLWFDSELPFIDKDRKVISYNARPGGKSILINTNYIKKSEISYYKDLLKPQYKGKIIINDPTASGSGSSWFSVAVETGKPGLEFMRELAKQEPFLYRDERQQVDWVAKGRYLIGIALDRETINEYVASGAPIESMGLQDEAHYITAGGANIGLINKAPHPKATRVFINWLLSKEGQTLNSRLERQQSRRLDVPTDHLKPDLIRDSKIKYFYSNREEWHARRLEFNEMARQVFTPDRK